MSSEKFPGSAGKVAYLENTADNAPGEQQNIQDRRIIKYIGKLRLHNAILLSLDTISHFDEYISKKKLDLKTLVVRILKK